MSQFDWILPDDTAKGEWDAFVRSRSGSIFSESTYLDATAENWIILKTRDGRGGMVCPFTRRLGVSILYSPFFHRYTEWIGEKIGEDELLQELRQRFSVANFQLKGTLHSEDSVARMHQVIQSVSQPNSLAKRMLNKSDKANYIVECVDGYVEELVGIIRDELPKKMKEWDGRMIARLKQLLEKQATVSQLRTLLIKQQNTLVGGIYLIENDTSVLYLKGACSSEAKQNGAMYSLMQTAIELALQQQKEFDFGGSSVEGVRRFNLNFGAEDIQYTRLEWNNAPFWWKGIAQMKRKWKRK